MNKYTYNQFMRRLCYITAGVNIPLAALWAAVGNLPFFLLAILSGLLLTFGAQRYGRR